MNDFYRHILTETNTEALIKFFTKKWDKERKSGQIPRFNWKEVGKLGLLDQQKEIRNALIEYYVDHYKDQWRPMIEEFITSKTFSTADIEKSGIDVGGYDFEFKIIRFNIFDWVIRDARQVPSMDCEVEFVITKGEVNLFGQNDIIKSLTDPKNQKLGDWWEVLVEIKDIINPFLKQVILEFGFKLNIMSLTNRTYENNFLEETANTTPELTAKRFLDSLKLENWHSEKYGMQYLATKKGTIIILIDTYTASIQSQIYDSLTTIFSNDEERFETFMKEYLVSKDIIIGDTFNYIDSSERVGDIEDDDDVKGPLVYDTKDTDETELQESKGKMLPKNKFAKMFLSKFNDLKKYKSADEYYIYLVNDSGKILVSLNTQINETAVDDRIWNGLRIYFDEKETRRKLISWLLDEYNLTNMGYLYKADQSVLDRIESGDTLIDRNQITESKDVNKLKDFFFKKWTKQKESGQTPKLNSKEIKGLGLSNFKNEIITYYGEFMGLDPEDTNRRSEVIKNYLLSNTFDERDIPDVTYFLDQGKMKIKFDSVEFIDDETGSVFDVDVHFEILSGSFYNEEENTIVNFSAQEGLPFEDMWEFFEFKNVIKEIVENFIGETLENFGFDVNRYVNNIIVRF